MHWQESGLTDPLAEVITLLQPTAEFSKTVVGAGKWQVPRADLSSPLYYLVLEGRCHATVDGEAPIECGPGDFVLVPTGSTLELSSFASARVGAPWVCEPLPSGEYRIGRQDGPVDMRTLVGRYRFGSPDAALLVSLLPRLVHVRSGSRVEALVRLIDEEWHAQRPARDVVLARLLEVLLIDALRSTTELPAAQGLARALADPRIGNALRAMHAHPEQAWTIPTLAQAAALSRSTFFERFSQRVGVAPMAYLLTWRMALAQRLLRGNATGIAEVARRVGYGSASTFSTAFTRHVGVPPSRYLQTATTPRYHATVRPR